VRNIILSMLFGMVLTGLAALPANAQWRRAETAHFIVYGDTSESALRTYARKVERFDALLRAYYPVPIDHEIPKLEIFLAEGLGDMRQVSPRQSSGGGGYYSPNSSRIHAVVNTDSDMGDHVLFHEYAHHFMYQMASAAYPAWFVEGFAEYYSTVELRENRVRVGLFSPGRMNSLTLSANSWAPLEDVLRWRVSASGRYRGSDYYAMSWALTHYMYSDPERLRALGRYLAAVAQGADSVQAMQDATGRTAAQLQDDVRRYLAGAIPVLTPSLELNAGEITITTLPPSSRDLMWLDLRLDRLEGWDVSEIEDEKDRNEAIEDRATAIEMARRLSARWPGDRMAALVAARGQNLGGDRAAALATLEPLIEGDGEDDPVALHLAAVMLMDQASVEGQDSAALTRRARGYLARALEADPLDFRIYLALDRSRRGAPGYPSENDMATIEVAVALAPQSFDARLTYAAILLARSRPGEAAMILAPVANSPHATSGRTAAREMLARAREQAGLAPANGDAPTDTETPADDAG